MDDSDPLLAKSTGETLEAHLRLTLLAADEVGVRVGRIPSLPEDLAGRFWTIVRLAALFHDTGKFLEGFRLMLVTGRPWGRRHEVASLGFVDALIEDPVLREWIALAVVTHHRPLSSTGSAVHTIRRLHGRLKESVFIAMFGTYDDAKAAALGKWLTERAAAADLTTGPGPVVPADILPRAHRLLEQLLEDWTENDQPDDVGLAAILLQGAVTMADHVSSAHGVLHTRQPLGPAWAEDFRALHSPMYPYQEITAAITGHVLVRAPTGRGKTEAGFLWAITQLEDIAARTEAVPRLFYLLPYLAAINAMYHRATDKPNPNNPKRCPIATGDEVGVAHSRAGSFYLSASIACEDEENPTRTAKQHARQARYRAEATRLFRETIRIGTPYQVLRGALAGPVYSSILLDSANAVFILDELHAYDAKRMGMILAMARVWDRIGSRIAVLSATMPDQLVALIQDTLPGMQLIDAYVENTEPRHRIRVHEQHLTDPVTIDAIRERVAAGQAVLVVANNIADAQHIHAQLADHAAELHGEDAVHQLHSKYKRVDRAVLENAIVTRHGSANDPVPGLTVTTQVCEVSLDVSFDVLFTSAAPLEALAQRFGRVNRLGKLAPVDVHICRPDYRERRNSRSGLYADGVYPAEPVQAAWDILTAHDGEPVDEKEITGWLSDVYDSAWGEQWREDVEEHRRAFDAFFSFEDPFVDRGMYEDQYDTLFEGAEAILTSDRDAYAAALDQDRLLAEDLLIPLPGYAHALGTYDEKLKVLLIDGDYTPEAGLSAIRKTTKEHEYRLGEVY